MVEGKFFHGSYMLQVDRKQLKVVSLQFPPKELAHVLTDVQLSQTHLDCNLPAAGNADQFAIVKGFVIVTVTFS
jgi:hypothetical protein